MFNQTTPCYSADPAEQSFRRSLSILGQDWVHKFMFPVDKSVYLDQLHQSLSRARTITADMNISTLSAPFSDSFQLNEKIRFLFLPSFSTGAVSVGYQVTEYVSTMVSISDSPYIARSVRDDDNGVLINVAELPGSSVTEITCCTQLSPGFRDHVFMIVQTDLFKEVIHALSTGYDPEKMQQALIYTFQSSEVRQCPSCGKTSPVGCSCDLNLVRKTHPLDYEGDITNLRAYMGSYDGVSFMSIYEGGVATNKTISTTRASVAFSYDNASRKKMEAWAVQDAISGRTINLLKMMVPNVNMQPAHDSPLLEGVDQPFVGDVVDEVGAGKASYLTWSPFSDDVPGEGAIEEFIDCGDTNTILGGEFLDLATSLDDESMQSEHSAQSHTTTANINGESQKSRKTKHDCSTDVTRSDVSSSALLLASTDAKGAVKHPTMRNEPLQKPVVTLIPQQATAGSAQTPLPMQPIYQPNLTVPQVQPITPIVDKDAIMRPKRIGRPPAPKIRVATRVVPIVPATRAAAAAGVQKAMNAFSEDAIRKAELRKARNRASAIRSNQRKKMEIQDLKDSLHEAKEKETALRKEERALREANLALRAKLSG